LATRNQRSQEANSAAQPPLGKELVNMTTQTTTPKLSTVERLLEEVDEWSGRVAKIRQRMSRLRPGSDPYLDMLSDLWVELNWREQKTKHAAEAIDAFQESLPEDEAD
jgi:hypothetical protein